MDFNIESESTEYRLNIKQETQAKEPTGLIRVIRIIRVLKKNQQFVFYILVLRNAFEKTRKQMKANALSINALSDNLNFPMFAELTLKKT